MRIGFCKPGNRVSSLTRKLLAGHQTGVFYKSVIYMPTGKSRVTLPGAAKILAALLIANREDSSPPKQLPTKHLNSVINLLALKFACNQPFRLFLYNRRVNRNGVVSITSGACET